MYPITYEFLGTGHNRYGNYIYQDCFNRTLSNICHSHDFYELTLVCKGSCTHIINEKKHIHTNDEIIFLRPGDYHTFLSQSEDIRVLSLSVERNEFESFCNAYDNRIIKTLTDKTDAPVIRYPGAFSGIINHINVHDEYDCKFILSYFIKIYIDATHKGKYDIPKTIERALKDMYKPENVKVGIPAMVELSGYSRPHLSRLIKKYRGVTLHEYISTIRLDASYKALILSTASIEEIAENIGFSSLSHFYKAFKERFGVTPASLRKKAWNEQDPIVF